MSAALSRRFGKVAAYPPIVGMPLEEKFRLIDLAAGRRTEFEDLPERYQRLIVEAEANRRRHVAATEAGDPYALDHLWAEAAGLTLEQAVEAGALPGQPRRPRRRQPSRAAGRGRRKGVAPAEASASLGSASGGRRDRGPLLAVEERPG
ncbi:MAG: hypothetical protein ACRDI2_20070 [Chloroflexota bacterium]